MISYCISLEFCYKFHFLFDWILPYELLPYNQSDNARTTITPYLALVHTHQTIISPTGFKSNHNLYNNAALFSLFSSMGFFSWYKRSCGALVLRRAALYNTACVILKLWERRGEGFRCEFKQFNTNVMVPQGCAATQHSKRAAYII